MNEAETSGVASSRPNGLRVVEVDPASDGRWDAFVATHPETLVYHHSSWLQALASEYSQQVITLLCEDERGGTHGILPLIRTRGLPFKVTRGGHVTGRRLSSLPRTPVAGPVAGSSAATRKLLEAAIERARAAGIQLEIKTETERLDGLASGLVRTPWRLTYALDLPSANEDLRFGNSRNHSRIKWAVNKAKTSNVQVRAAETETDWREWYQLYLETMRLHVVPPRAFRFFRALDELLRPQGFARLLLAERRQSGRAELLAGAIFLLLGRTAFYAFNSSRRAVLPLRPNDLLLWTAIHDARSAGFARVDLGEVAEGHEQLAEFKRKWGTTPIRLYRYYYPAHAARRSESSSDGYAAALAGAAWRRVPLGATERVGDRLYSFL